MKKDNIEDILAEVFASLAWFFIAPALVRLCWNAIIPDIFGLTTLTYWQSFALYVLSNVLFKKE